MTTTRVTVTVREDTVVRADRHALDSGGVQAFLSVGEWRQVSLWGSPAALRRLAVALLGAANATERVSAQRASAAEREAA